MSKNAKQKEWDIEFGINLEQKLKEKELNKSELSELTGIDKSTITKYTLGKRTASSYNVSVMAKALGCSTDELIMF